MNYPDVINALFESFGFFAVGASCIKVLKDKQVKGVSYATVGFFTSWGLWNLYYYPHLGQVASSVGALLTCVANGSWLVLIIKYKQETK